MERAVGREFASAFLAVVWPGKERKTSVSEPEASYRRILEADLDGANTDSEKDRLTLGLFSRFDNSPELMSELERYAESAKGDVELDVDEARGLSNFPLVSGFGGLLYKEFCHRFFFCACTPATLGVVLL